MMKFFRKYNKQLLAVMMALLMIVFIGGSALEGLLTPSLDRTIGTSRFGEITDQDLQREQQQVTNILEFSGKDWNRMFESPEPLELLDWYLLAKESASLGVAADVAEVKAMTENQAVDDQVRLLADRLRLRPDAIHRAMAEYRSVQNAALAFSAATYPSEAEVQQAARDALEKADIAVVVVPAQSLVSVQPEPTEEELLAHFEKYKAQEPGPGLNFGYYRQPSAKAQFVRIDRDAITETIGVANLERKARAYFEENREKHLPFKRHPGNNPEPPATPEGEAEDPKAAEFLTWEEGKHIAMGGVKKEHATKAAAELAKWIIESAEQDWVDAPRRDSGYKEASDKVKSPDYFAEMLTRLPPNLSFPGAVSVETTDWFTAQETRDVAELGEARNQPGGGVGPSFVEMANRSEAFIPEIPKRGVSESEFLALWQTGPSALHNADSGNFYVFRMIEKAPGRPAQSLDEVRERVIADVKLAKAFEDAGKRLASLANCMGEGSLKDAHAADDELSHFANEQSDPPGGYFEPAPFSRVPFPLAGRGRSKEGIYVGRGLARLPNDAVDRIFALAESNDRTGVIELPDRATVVLVEVQGLIRAEEDEFNSLKAEVGQQLGEARWRRAMANWLNPEAIRARNHFKQARN